MIAKAQGTDSIVKQTIGTSSDGVFVTVKFTTAIEAEEFQDWLIKVRK